MPIIINPTEASIPDLVTEVIATLPEKHQEFLTYKMNKGNSHVRRATTRHDLEQKYDISGGAEKRNEQLNEQIEKAMIALQWELAKRGVSSWSDIM
jgi:hypothetical protein